MAKKTAPAPVSDITRNPDGSLKPIGILIQESNAAAAAADYPVATPEQVTAAATAIVRVELRGSHPDAFGGRPGSKASGHNTLFLSLPECLLSKATIQGVIESMEFTDTKGQTTRGKYNPCHMDNLCSEVRTQGIPAVARVNGYYCLNPLWRARFEAASGRKLANVGSIEPAKPARKSAGLGKATRKAEKVRKPVAPEAPAETAPEAPAAE